MNGSLPASPSAHLGYVNILLCVSSFPESFSLSDSLNSLLLSLKPLLHFRSSIFLILHFDRKERVITRKASEQQLFVTIIIVGIIKIISLLLS